MVLQAETPYERLVEAHRALADASDDAVERAHHMARLTAGPDPVVAARLSAAASAARRRGAPKTAARLGRLAAEYTPAGQTHIDIDRRLTAAEDAIEAGDLDFARQLAHEVLGDADRPADRVRAWNVVIDSCGQAMAEIADVFPEAVRDAGGRPRTAGPAALPDELARVDGGRFRGARPRPCRPRGLARGRGPATGGPSSWR